MSGRDIRASGEPVQVAALGVTYREKRAVHKLDLLSRWQTRSCTLNRRSIDPRNTVVCDQRVDPVVLPSCVQRGISLPPT
jgi:hypothetical protein